MQGFAYKSWNFQKKQGSLLITFWVRNKVIMGHCIYLLYPFLREEYGGAFQRRGYCLQEALVHMRWLPSYWSCWVPPHWCWLIASSLCSPSTDQRRSCACRSDRHGRTTSRAGWSCRWFWPQAASKTNYQDMFRKVHNRSMFVGTSNQASLRWDIQTHNDWDRWTERTNWAHIHS